MTVATNKVLFFIGADWYFCSHRLDLALGLRQAGYDVAVLTHVTAPQYRDRILASGFRLIESPLQRGSMNPFSDVRAMGSTLRTYRAERPELAHHVGIKPILYGSLACVLTSTPAFVNAFAGTGYLFNSSHTKARAVRTVVSRLMRALINRGNSRIILQSPEAREELVASGMADADRIVLIRGSGVDLSVFAPVPEPPGRVTVVLPARMLWEKGVGDFVEAARILAAERVPVSMVLVGAPDRANPATISERQLEEWRKSGVVDWLGHRTDMASVMAASHVVCLPSHHEGVPKVLIEAAASARPIVASDIPGCREIVRHMENGLLFRKEDPKSLAEAIRRLVEDAPLRARLGRRGRAMAEASFSIEQVVEQTTRLYESLLHHRPKNRGIA